MNKIIRLYEDGEPIYVVIDTITNFFFRKFEANDEKETTYSIYITFKKKDPYVWVYEDKNQFEHDRDLLLKAFEEIK